MTGPAHEEDDVKAGRRAYDDTVPTVVYIEEKLLRVFEEALKDTRHSLKQDMAALATNIETVKLSVADSTLRSTREHGEVQAHLAQMTLILSEVPPLKAAVSELQAAQQTDAGADALRSTVWKAAGVVAGLLISLSAVLVAVV